MTQDSGNMPPLLTQLGEIESEHAEVIRQGEVTITKASKLLLPKDRKNYAEAAVDSFLNQIEYGMSPDEIQSSANRIARRLVYDGMICEIAFPTGKNIIVGFATGVGLVTALGQSWPMFHQDLVWWLVVLAVMAYFVIHDVARHM